MEFSFEQPRPRSQSAAGMNNTEQAVGSDRLRKAIERNRAKQAKRSSQSGQSEKGWNLPKSSTKTSSNSVSPTRRSVGKAGEQEFTTQLRKRGSRSPSPVSYSTLTAAATTTTSVPARTRKKLTTVKSLGTSGKTKRKRSKKLAATNEYIIKGVWVFCALLFIRLIVSDGGVMDFYAQHEVLQGRFDEKARIEKENMALVKEIELLRKNPNYQKKVVRDHLGYIAADEYLILFPES